MRTFAPLLAVLLLFGCVTEEPGALPTDDAGDEAWVRQVLPLLWGRQARSARELAVLVGAVDEHGRADVVRAMAGSPDYRARQEVLLLDALVVNRMGTRKNERCWGVTTSAAQSADLAAFVRAEEPTAGGWTGAPWTMLDLLRSAVRADDLSPLYEAALFALLAVPFEPPNQSEALAVRTDLAHVFMRTHLGRNMDCMPCHNSEWSVTGHVNPDFDRTWELPGYTEQALFGVSEGRPIEEIAALFRKKGVTVGFQFAEETRGVDGCFPTGLPGCDRCDCEQRVCDLMPSCCTDAWTNDCAATCRDDQGQDMVPGENPNCVQYVPADFDGCTPAMSHPGCNGCACEEEVCAMNPLCCERGWSSACSDSCRAMNFCADEQSVNPEKLSGVAPWGMNSECGRFLRPAQLEGDPLNQAGFWIDALEDGSIWAVQSTFADGVEALPRDGLRIGPDSTVDPGSAIAWMWAARMANLVWGEAYGAPLIIANWFPRAEPQGEALELLATRFAAADWSLTELWVEATTHPLFNLVAPADLAPEESPYALGRIFNPWTNNREVDPERIPNSMADAVHRRQPRVLVSMIHGALGWPAYPAFPLGDPNNEYRVQEDLGFFLKDSLPGFTGADLQGLAAWEETYGRCRHPEQGDDWIAALAEAAAGQGVTVGAAVSALKDRLLTDPTLADDEVAVLSAVSGLDFGAAAAEGLEDGLRWACGVFLASPQLHLAGLPPENTLVQGVAPAPRVALSGDGLAEHCAALAPLFVDGLACDE